MVTMYLLYIHKQKTDITEIILKSHMSTIGWGVKERSFQHGRCEGQLYEYCVCERTESCRLHCSRGTRLARAQYRSCGCCDHSDSLCTRALLALVRGSQRARVTSEEFGLPHESRPRAASCHPCPRVEDSGTLGSCDKNTNTQRVIINKETGYKIMYSCCRVATKSVYTFVIQSNHNY